MYYLHSSYIILLTLSPLFGMFLTTVLWQRVKQSQFAVDAAATAIAVVAAAATIAQVASFVESAATAAAAAAARARVASAVRPTRIRIRIGKKQLRKWVSELWGQCTSRLPCGRKRAEQGSERSMRCSLASSCLILFAAKPNANRKLVSSFHKNRERRIKGGRGAEGVRYL